MVQFGVLFTVKKFRMVEVE